ncbi:bifunctional alpha,alpha-trehalose-phosphate synthase (UDP-forming)/trehalose-phosphatase [soil metagenome]
MEKTARTIIVSNRLPIKIKREGEELKYETSEGGLATGLGSIYKQGGNIWIGWPGLYLEREEEEYGAVENLQKQNMSPVFLTENEIKDYYEGFSNETLWPTCHYFPQYAVYEQTFWEAYEKVNRKFCDQVVKVAGPDDTIWVHDYQLLLLPQMIRELLPDSSIGFFQHIPFPSFEIFRLLPWRRALLNGILGADLIGFHTYDDMRHFLSSISRIVGFGNTNGMIDTGIRTVMVDAFPMGIDYEKYASVATSQETLENVEQLNKVYGDRKMILSIDRLDYSKGIPNRLLAFEHFLQTHPEYLEKVVLVMVVVPSRDQVGRYKELKEEVDELVGRINSSYSTINWSPIQYFYRSFPLDELSAFYTRADIALVTPMRDGMNLVCKEYLASKHDQTGVLILSEMAGASRELSEAIQINPNNLPQMADAMYDALTMEEEDQKAHIENMQKTLKKYNIHHWVDLFMNRLAFIKSKQMALATSQLDQSEREYLKQRYEAAQNRLIFLDYDGTLSPFQGEPQRAHPDEELITLLQDLTADPKNRVVIISGRDRETLGTWLDGLYLAMIAEHGVWLKERGEDWQMIQPLRNDWKKEIRPIMELHVSRTPGSLLEEKDFSLVWHYRKVETGLGEVRVSELISHLSYIANSINLQLLEGDKVIEIKNVEVNKGKAAFRWIETYPHDYVLAIGDDKTDEDTFKAMPDNAFTIKVGNSRSVAKYYLDSFQEVRSLLLDLVKV